jgi:hypothetical protein
MDDQPAAQPSKPAIPVVTPFQRSLREQREREAEARVKAMSSLPDPGADTDYRVAADSTDTASPSDLDTKLGATTDAGVSAVDAWIIKKVVEIGGSLSLVKGCGD